MTPSQCAKCISYTSYILSHPSPAQTATPQPPPRPQGSNADLKYIPEQRGCATAPRSLQLRLILAPAFRASSGLPARRAGRTAPSCKPTGRPGHCMLCACASGPTRADNGLHLCRHIGPWPPSGFGKNGLLARGALGKSKLSLGAVSLLRAALVSGACPCPGPFVPLTPVTLASGAGPLCAGRGGAPGPGCPPGP